MGVVLAGFFEIALPRWVEQRIQASLRDRGIDARLEVVDVGLTRTTIRRISLPEQGLEIEEAILRYSLRDLLAGRIDTLVVGEAALALDRYAAGARLGAAGEAWSPPLDRIEVTALEITSKAWRSRVAGTVERHSTGFAVDLHATGSAPRAPAFELALAAHLGAGEIAYDLALREPRAGQLRARGTLAGNLAAWRSAAAVPFTVDAELDARSFMVAQAARHGASIDAPSIVQVTARGELDRSAHGWGARVDAATLRASAGAIAAAGRHQLGQVALELALSGRADPSGVAFTVHPGSQLGAERLRATGKALAVRSEAEQAAALSVTRPVIAELSTGGRWSVSAPALRLRAAGLALATPALHTAVTALDVPLWLESSPADTRAGFLAGGTVATGPGRLTIASRRVALDPLALAVRASRAGDAYHSGHHGVRIELGARRPFTARAGTAARVRSLEIEARATLAGAEPRLTSAVVTAEGGDVRIDQLEVGSVAVRAPFRWTSDRREPGAVAVRVQRASWRGHDLPPLSGRIETRDGRRRFIGTSVMPDGLALSIAATADERQPQDLVVAVDAPRFVVRRHGPTGRLLEELLGVKVDGAVSFEARLAVAEGRVRREGRLRLDDVTVAATGGELVVGGLRGDVWLAPPGTTRSRAVQTLRWRRAVVAGQPLGAGAVRFSLPSDRAVRVKSAELAAGGGTISLAPLTIDLDAPAVRATMHMNGLDMRRWLPIASRGKLTGTGTFDGDLAVELVARPWSLSLGKGRLATRGRGRLQVRDPDLLNDLATRASSRTKASVRKVLEERLVIALADFDYRALTLELFDGAGPELTLAVRGRGHRIAQEVDLTVNATGVAEALRMAGTPLARATSGESRPARCCSDRRGR